MSSETENKVTVQMTVNVDRPIAPIFEELERKGIIVKASVKLNAKKLLAIKLDYIKHRGDKRTAEQKKCPKTKKDAACCCSNTSNVNDNNRRPKQFDRKSLYCFIPDDLPDNQKEQEFLSHFSQFGKMEYCHGIRFPGGSLKVGFVKYKSEEAAEYALKHCDRKYKPKYFEGMIS